MIRFNANLFRIAAMCQSNEETHYYLCGVFVEPHSVKGVTLTTTDGHKMLVIHDETGFADESAIIRLSDMKPCKAKRGMVRVVTIETGANEASFMETFETASDDETAFHKVGAAFDVRVDGTFPDYRRVVPKSFGDSPAPAFASIHLLAMASVGTELAAHFHDFQAKRCASAIDRKDVIHIRADKENPTGAPSLVTWPVMPAAFGVLMPVAWKNPAELPDWFGNPVAAPSVAPVATALPPVPA